MSASIEVTVLVERTYKWCVLKVFCEQRVSLSVGVRHDCAERVMVRGAKVES